MKDNKIKILLSIIIFLFIIMMLIQFYNSVVSDIVEIGNILEDEIQY